MDPLYPSPFIPHWADPSHDNPPFILLIPLWADYNCCIGTSHLSLPSLLGFDNRKRSWNVASNFCFVEQQLLFCCLLFSFFVGLWGTVYPYYSETGKKFVRPYCINPFHLPPALWNSASLFVVFSFSLQLCMLLLVSGLKDDTLQIGWVRKPSLFEADLGTTFFLLHSNLFKAEMGGGGRKQNERERKGLLSRFFLAKTFPPLSVFFAAGTRRRFSSR